MIYTLEVLKTNLKLKVKTHLSRMDSLFEQVHAIGLCNTFSTIQGLQALRAVLCAPAPDAKLAIVIVAPAFDIAPSDLGARMVVSQAHGEVREA